MTREIRDILPDAKDEARSEERHGKSPHQSAASPSYATRGDSCEHAQGKPWGFWATVGFGVVIAAVYLAFQFVVMVPYAMYLISQNPGMDAVATASSLYANGFLLAVMTCLSVLPCIGLVLLFVRIRRGISWKEYLAFNPPRRRQVLVWIGIAFVYALAADGLNMLIGRSIVPEFWLKAYDTSGFAPLFFFALVVAAPLNEEIFFRGFLFNGFRHSAVGPMGAVLIAALVWTLIHTQYDYYDLGTLFAAGIIVGLARWWTNSIYVAIAMHMFINVWASVQILLHSGSQNAV